MSTPAALLADTVDALGVILPLLGVLGVVIFYAVSKSGRRIMKDSHDAGHKAGEKFAALFFKKKDK